MRVRAASARRALERGAALGRYLVIDALGEGATAAVYRAYDSELDRRVALKVLHPHAITEGREERLLDEARSLARLAHENIVTVFDAGRVDDRAFVALELVEGQTLRAWLAQTNRSWIEVVSVFAKAGRGLAAAHEAALVHRDFKPDNVLIGDDGRVRVADFGLALDASIAGDRSLVGTPAYMAPELFDGATADARSDQFAFCVALFEALFGARPFEGATLDALAAAARAGIVDVPAGRDVPSWLLAVVRRGTSADPSRRFHSMRALLDALPADPEADLRHSNAGRAALVATVVSLQFSLGLYFAPPGAPAPRSSPNGAQVALWVLVTAVIAAAIIARFRRPLLASRLSRQILVALATLYYTSVLVEYAAQRLAASEPFSVASTFSWAAACMVCLGMTVHRLFFATAAVSLGAGLAAIAWPTAAPWLSRITPFVMALLLIARWGASAQRSRSSSNASTQR